MMNICGIPVVPHPTLKQHRYECILVVRTLSSFGMDTASSESPSFLPTVVASSSSSLLLSQSSLSPPQERPKIHNNNNNNNNHHHHHITIVALNRPKKHNAINMKMWYEIGHVFTQLQILQDSSVIILMGMGKSFCAGIDMHDISNTVFTSVFSSSSSSAPSSSATSTISATTTTSTTKSILSSPRNQNHHNQNHTNNATAILRQNIQHMQECFTALEKCSIPIIAVLHGYCLGAGIDLICCTDIRICCCTDKNMMKNNNMNISNSIHSIGNNSNRSSGTTSTTNTHSANTIFAVKEVQMGFAPDVGTLQRLPKICGSNQSMIHELCFTGRNFDAMEAIEMGMVRARHCRSTLSECLHVAIYDIGAAMIAPLPNPVAVQHIKQSLLYSRHHPNVADGLHHIAQINAVALQSSAVRRAIQQQQQQQQSGKKKTARTPNNMDVKTMIHHHHHHHHRNDDCHMNNTSTCYQFNDDDDAVSTRWDSNRRSFKLQQQQSHRRQQSKL